MRSVTSETMRALRFHNHGEWSDVLRLEDVPIPEPRAGEVRIRVQACGLNPMDWVLCLGSMPGPVPCGVGLDVAGNVDAFGEGVTGLGVGERVFVVPVARTFSLDDWRPAFEACRSGHARGKLMVLPHGVDAGRRTAPARTSKPTHRVGRNSVVFDPHSPLPPAPRGSRALRE